MILGGGVPPSSSNRQKSCQNYSQLALYSEHCRDLKLVSSLATVRNSGSLFKSNFCNLFLPGNLAALCIIGVFARRELTVPIWLISGSTPPPPGFRLRSLALTSIPYRSYFFVSDLTTFFYTGSRGPFSGIR